MIKLFLARFLMTLGTELANAPPETGFWEKEIIRMYLEKNIIFQLLLGRFFFPLPFVRN